MALSGTSTFNPYAMESIRAAWRKCGVEEPDEKQMGNGWFALNVLLKSLSENEGINLWKNEWKVKKFSDPSEVTGTDGNIYTCVLSHTSAATNKPITGDEYLKFWRLRGSTGGVWATSTSYTSAGDFSPDTDIIAIDKAYIQYIDTRYDMDVIDRYQYFDIYDTGLETFPSYIWLDMSGTAPTIKLDCQVASTDYVLHYLQTVMLEDINHTSNTIDLPKRYQNALIYMLAADLADEMPNAEEALARGGRLMAKGQKLLKEAKRGGLEKPNRKIARRYL